MKIICRTAVHTVFGKRTFVRVILFEQNYNKKKTMFGNCFFICRRNYRILRWIFNSLVGHWISDKILFIQNSYISLIAFYPINLPSNRGNTEESVMDVLARHNIKPLFDVFLPVVFVMHDVHVKYTPRNGCHSRNKSAMLVLVSVRDDGKLGLVHKCNKCHFKFTFHHYVTLSTARKTCNSIWNVVNNEL